jgi:mannose-6-phosphate isomerase-like protein (cupin superfamily)
MKTKTLRFGKGFKVIMGNQRAQAATMVIPVGATQGGSDNNHRGADQWLFVVSGKGSATIGAKKVSIQTSSLILIERGQNHEIRNDGTTELVTLNVYVPPAYSPTGKELSTARPK